MTLDDTVNIQDAIDSLKTMIRVPVDDSELERKLDTYLNRYLMDVESSKRAIVKDYGGTDSDYIPPDEPDVRLSDRNIKRGSYMTFVAKVVKKTPIHYAKSGKTKYMITVEDESDTATIVSWNSDIEIEVGKVYRFKGWRVDYDSYENEIVISASNNGGFIETGEYHIESNAYSRNIRYAVDYDELKEGMSNIVVAGTVDSINYRQPGGRGPAISGILMMDGGNIRFISWDEGLDLDDGDDVCISRVKVKYNSYSDNIELVISEASEISKGD